MLIRSNPDEIHDFLTDAGNIKGGNVDKVFFPETAAEVSEVLREANATGTPVTVSGAGTGLVGGRVAFGGVTIAMDRFSEIKDISAESLTGVVGSGVILADYQKAVEAKNLFYPPDPTEWSCQMGGTVATNASGSRSFKYGATRPWIRRLEIVLPTGDILDLKRGEYFFGENGVCSFALSGGKKVGVKLPTYRMPRTSKHAAGYFSRPGMDLIDLFIGSEGTLGIVTEIETFLLPKPEKHLSGIVFFKDEQNLLDFVSRARDLSYNNRAQKLADAIDASLLEYFDRNSLDFIRDKFPLVPENMAGAVFFEQETTEANEESILTLWNELLEQTGAEIEVSWFAINDEDAKKMREFRHALPVAVNEWIVKHGRRKVSTDMAVSSEEFPRQLKFYRDTLAQAGLNYVIFGHIGDNHVHVNILPRDEKEAEKARHAYGRFIARACIVGGTISAEHGVGKLKRKYLNVMFGERFLNEMIEVKKTLDPKFLLGRGNMFDETVG
jgi:D-lactate dehydrogenase (cytochrome)